VANAAPRKWASVSTQRFSDLASAAAGSGGASAKLSGAAGEKVTVSWLDANADKCVEATCTLPSSGSATMTVGASGGASC